VVPDADHAPIFAAGAGIFFLAALAAVVVVENFLDGARPPRPRV
jgi:hypothetical protein